MPLSGEVHALKAPRRDRDDPANNQSYRRPPTSAPGLHDRGDNHRGRYPPEEPELPFGNPELEDLQRGDRAVYECARD